MPAGFFCFCLPIDCSRFSRSWASPRSRLGLAGFVTPHTPEYRRPFRQAALSCGALDLRDRGVAHAVDLASGEICGTSLLPICGDLLAGLRKRAFDELTDGLRARLRVVLAGPHVNPANQRGRKPDRRHRLLVWPALATGALRYRCSVHGESASFWIGLPRISLSAASWSLMNSGIGSGEGRTINRRLTFLRSPIDALIHRFRPANVAAVPASMKLVGQSALLVCDWSLEEAHAAAARASKLKRLRLLLLFHVARKSRRRSGSQR